MSPKDKYVHPSRRTDLSSISKGQVTI
uniref:Uncharacterized protein n=1 Tax=Anguilla anguilla TaxID=7936 RepID=A0A0E9V3S5_ANGAN